MIDEMEMSFLTKTSLKKYFKNEWWCEKWRESWLDITRYPLTQNGQSRTMTTNNHDENLNLKVADCIGGRRKKISTLVYEITGMYSTCSVFTCIILDIYHENGQKIIYLNYIIS